MKEIRFANKIIRILVKDRMHYPGRLIVDTVALIARCGILLVLYWYVFKLNGGLVNSVTYNIVAWSMFFYFVFSTFRLRDVARSIMRDIQSGNIEVFLNRPISYLSYKTWWQIGSGIYSFLLVAILGSLGLFFIIGIPTTMTIGIFLPTLFLVFLGASILTLLVYALVGVLAFWIEDINPVFWIVDKAVMILGGSYLPIALFPPFLYKIALYSPFGASQFITHTVNESWKSDWYVLILIQLFWIIVSAIVLYFLYSKAKNKLSVNGG
jgi:ABC-2 type transport system permease protein